MDTSWKRWVFEKAESIIKTASTPLSAKEIAWKAINFTLACGQSDPVSFCLRPVVSHKNLRRSVGVFLVFLALVTTFWGPMPSLASDTGGVPVMVLPEGEVILTTQEAIAWPVESREISQGYWLFHGGIDIRTPEGSPINPVMAGKISETEIGRYGYGEKVVIIHDAGYRSLYAHLSEIQVSVGQEVTTESVIGLSGNTGRSTGPHLHLEIHHQGKHINPLSILGNKQPQ